MKNNKKHSAVMLAPSYPFTPTSKTVIFQPEMLTWPIFSFTWNLIDEEETSIYRSALEALSLLSPFDSMISMEVNSEKKQLILARRTHGHIFLNGESLVSFTPDSRGDNPAYFSLFEWVDMESIALYEKETLHKTSVNKIITTLHGWGKDGWINFFFNKLIERAAQLDKNSKAERQEAIIQDAMTLVRSAKKNYSYSFSCGCLNNVSIITLKP